MSSSYQKEAVAIVLDASPSMNATFESRGGDYMDNENHGKPQTRFEWAKSAILDTISNLIFRGSKNLCAVFVTHTAKASHHMSTEEFPNVVVYNSADTPSGLLPPTVAFLQQLDEALQFDQVSKVDDNQKKPIRVNTWDGIVVAADALWQKTSKQKFDRRLLIFTDACCRLEEPKHLHHVMEGLNQLNCRLEVIVVDFQEKLPSHVVEGKPTDEEEDQSSCDSSTESGMGTKSQDDRIENIQFFQILSRYTGGITIATSSKEQLLVPSLGRKFNYSRQSKCLLNIAPGLSVPVRFAPLTSETKFPYLKKFALSIKQDGTAETDMFGEEVTHNIIRTTTHRDPDRPHVELSLEEKAKAYCFGSSLIPIGDLDVEGLRIRSDPIISILKYWEIDTMPQSHFIGSPYLITDADPDVDSGQEENRTRSSVLVSALAQALNELNYCAICRFVKKKDDDPLSVAMFPLVFPAKSTTDITSYDNNSTVERKLSDSMDGDQSCKNKFGLAFVQLPFCEDIIPLSLPSLANLREPVENVTVCDNLIQSLMIPPNELESTSISNPSLRCMYRNVMVRAMRPKQGIMPDGDSWIPSATSSESLSIIQRFHELFPVHLCQEDGASIRGSGWKNSKKRSFADLQE
jgi:hypothetical protein